MRMWVKNSILNQKRDFVFSLGINLVIFVLFIFFTNITYETNDDYNISSKINAGYYNITFINFFLNYIVVKLQGIFCKINLFILLQIIGSFVAFVVLTYIILKTNGKTSIFNQALLILFLVIFAYDHYYLIQFTKTASLLMTAGFISINYYTNNFSKVGIISGILLLLAGSWLDLLKYILFWASG